MLVVVKKNVSKPGQNVLMLSLQDVLNKTIFPRYHFDAILAALKLAKEKLPKAGRISKRAFNGKSLPGYTFFFKPSGSIHGVIVLSRTFWWEF